MEHFEELPNGPAPQDPPTTPTANGDLPFNRDLPTKREIYQYIKQLKKGKSAGPASIPTEALKWI